MLICIITMLLASWCLFSIAQYIFYWYFQRDIYDKETYILKPFTCGKYYMRKGNNLLIQFLEGNKTIIRIYKVDDVRIEKGDLATLEDITIRPALSKMARLNLFYQDLLEMVENDIEYETVITVP